MPVINNIQLRTSVRIQQRVSDRNPGDIADTVRWIDIGNDVSGLAHTEAKLSRMRHCKALSLQQSGYVMMIGSLRLAGWSMGAICGKS